MRDLIYYYEIEKEFEEKLDEIYEEVSICGYEYSSVRALRNIDPIAFHCGVREYEGENYEEVPYSDMTEEERENFMVVSTNQVMYVRVA